MNSAIQKLASVVLIFMAAAVTIVAQNRTPTPATAPPIHSSLVEADELFVLDIKERRIFERNFEASTAVGVGADDRTGVSVKAGVSLQAQSIDVLLRNVSGTVRFRGSLQRIVDLINSHPR